MTPKTIALAVAISLALLSGSYQVASADEAVQVTAHTQIETAYRTQSVGELEIFYREAGPADAPVVLLLHGYPSSSHMYRDLIWRLADRYRVIAPDLPGFGSTKAPPRGEYDYSFANLAVAMEGFTEALGLDRYALYVFDYGAPTGFRLAVKHPERVTAIISQNGNAYEEGLLPAWGAIRTYWENPTQENRDALRVLQTIETTTWQYTAGVPDDLLHLVGPDGIAHDQSILDRAEGAEIQLDLQGDYKSNVALYPEWQAYFREYQPPLLAIWGENDPFFGPDGARAFSRDIEDAEIHFVDSGHFALETHAPEIAAKMRDFLARHLADG